MIAEKLKKAVLKAAMEGKLTEQLASDGTSKDQLEPSLLKYIIKENSGNSEIPENWLHIKLRALIKLVSGRDLKTSEYNDKKNGIPYITGASNFFENSLLINRWTNRPEVISEKGDLLITVKGTIGLLNYNNIGDIHIARQIMAIKSTHINIDYLKFFLSQYVEILNKKAKSFIPGISRSDILDIVFPLPPRNEQKRIVEKLEILLAEIDKLEQDEKALKDLEDKFPEKLKNSILEHYLSGRFVKEEISCDSYLLDTIESSKIKSMSNINSGNYFDLPKDWLWIKLKDLGKMGMGQTILKKDMNKIGDPVYSATIEHKPLGYIKRPLNKLNLKHGDFVIPARGASIGHIKLIDEENASCTQTTMYMKSYYTELSKYLYYCFLGLNNKIFIRTGSAQPQITVGITEEQVIPLPSIKIREIIVEKLDELFNMFL